MSDDLPPTAVGGLPSDSNGARDSGSSSEPSTNTTAANSSSATSQRSKAGLSKKLQFTTHLMSTLDMFVAVELCVLYYMDCSFFRLLIRALPQSFFLSPKSDDFLLLMPAHRPHVFAIFLPNAVCFLLHLFASLPSASEAARGYLHGGVMIDFVGQKAPTSRFGLLLLDIVVLVLQCFMLAVHAERERLRKILLPASRTAAANLVGDGNPGSSPSAPTQEDHDAEERGVLRDGPNTGESEEGIELQPVSSRERRHTFDENEVTQLLGEPSQRGATLDLEDVLRSGNAVIADLHVLHALRTAGNDYQSAAEHSLQTIGYAAQLARMAAERRARVDAQRGPT